MSRTRRPSLLVETLEDRTVPSTVQTFDGGSPYVLHGYGAPPPDDTVPGPTGNLLRLATGTAGSVGSITFGVTDPEAFKEVRMNFDFRMIPTNGRADGFGIELLNTDDFEYGPAAFVGGFSEEANYRKSLGIGFDIFPNIGEVSNNHVSIHFNEQKLVEVDVTSFGIDLASGNMIHAAITARFGVTGTSGDVTVVLTPSGGNPTTVLNQFVVPNLLPYHARVHAMARSGGQAAHHDLDNIDVQYIGPDKGTIQLTAPTYTVVESQPAAVVKVIRTGGTLGQVTVTIATANGSAIAGQDLTGIAPTVLTFADGETTKVINISILNDAVAEADETFTVTLSNATNGAALGAPVSATVTIFDVDDDPASLVGSWSAAMPLEVVAIHQVMLPSGEILFWSRHGAGEDGDPRLFNPATGVVRMAAMLNYDIFCAGHTLMADGRVFVAGGHITDGAGENKASIYDPRTDIWTPVPNMNKGRWYPTVTLLPNGDLLVIGGTYKDNPFDANEGPKVNALSQVYQVKTNTWRDLSTAPLGNFPDYSDFYPWATVAHDGRIFISGPQQTGRYLDTSGTGAWTDVADSLLLYRDYGSSIEFSEGTVLIAGGKPRVDDNANPGVLLPSDTAEVIDLNAAVPSFQPVASMTTGRRHLNLTVLPNDTVLATGGSSAPGFQDFLGAVLYPELWNPTSNTWTPQAAHAFPLLYHSNAMLLPTAQVLVTGGGQPAPLGGQDEPRAQIFSPAYLFNGARPTIASAPASVNYGQSFAVQTSNPASIAKVTLIPLPAPTHAFNENQGIERLSFTTTGTGVSATAPANPNEAPPGFYYLFATNSAGVPSVAKIIQLGTSATIDQAVGQADPTNGSSVMFDVVFSAPVTGFGPTDVDLSDSAVGGNLLAAVSGSGATYTVTVTGMTGSGTVVARVRFGAAVDGFDIGTIASTSTDNTVDFDTSSPTVTVNQSAGQPDPTNGSPVSFTVLFSEPVTGFLANDVSFAGSTVGGTLLANVTGSGTSYTVLVTGMSGAGTIVVSILAGAAQDSLGNTSTASNSAIVNFDNVAPMATINQAAGQADPTSATHISFTVQFSEPVTGFAGADISFADSTVSGTLQANVTGSGANYTVTITGMNGGGTVVASIPAGAVTDTPGNANVASTSTDNTVTFVEPPPAPLIVSGQLNGSAGVFPPNTATGQYPTTPTVTVSPFPGFNGQVRTASADVNGDGFPDTICVTGPGTPIRVAVVSGENNTSLLVPLFPPFVGSESFDGGGFVTAADIDGDGKAEFAITPDRGGGPRVTIFSLVGADAIARANFFGIDDKDFRGGARAAFGDVNNDGTPELVVCAGFLGGPRTAIFQTVLNSPTRVVGDFFAFPGADAITLRNGVFVASGDVDGDGFADLIFGGGPGGAPRVFILSGAKVIDNNVGISGAQAAPIANFFVANNSSDRGGVRVASKDADGDAKAEVIAGSGEGSPAKVRIYLGKNFSGAGEPGTFQDISVFGGDVLPGGVFVG